MNSSIRPGVGIENFEYDEKKKSIVEDHKFASHELSKKNRRLSHMLKRLNTIKFDDSDNSGINKMRMSLH